MNRVVSRPAISITSLPLRRRTRFLECAETGFPAAPATLHARNKLRPRSPFSDGRMPETGLTLLNGVNFSRAMPLACILMHAVKQSLRVSGGFSGGLLPVCRFPVRNALKPFLRCVQSELLENGKYPTIRASPNSPTPVFNFCLFINEGKG